MKTKKLIFFFGILLLSFGCSDNDELSENNSLVYISTELGDCDNKIVFLHIQDNKDTIIDNQDKDTIITFIEADFLNIFIGYNYTCCTDFDTQCEVKNDSVLITIKDTCPSALDCYCRCTCYYTFDFKFSGIKKNKKYVYKVLFFDPRVNKNKIIFEGNLKL
jgi:hypothetical protein